MGKIRIYSLREILFVLALATKPIYLSNSGSMQPSDIIYMALFGLFVLDGKLSFSSIQEKKWIKLFSYLIVYQFTINLIWYIASRFQGFDDTGMITRIFYYVFNLFVCITTFQMYEHVGFSRLLHLYLIGSGLSVGICYIGVVLNWRGIGRVTGFFNNPNQLGYYAIIVMTVFVVFCKETKKKYVLTLIILCIILNIWSLSKASIIGAAVLLISYALISNEGKGNKSTVISIILIAFIAIFLYMFMFSDMNIFSGNYYVNKVRRRILLMAYENDSNLSSGRGYGRIFEIGAFIFTGVGQGAYDRFMSLSGKELHSTYASILVSYGLIGFAGYFYLFKNAMFSYKSKLYTLLAMSGVLLYSVTHNGIRSSLLWTLLAMLLLRPDEIHDGDSIDFTEMRTI